MTLKNPSFYDDVIMTSLCRIFDFLMIWRAMKRPIMHVLARQFLNIFKEQPLFSQELKTEH